MYMCFRVPSPSGCAVTLDLGNTEPKTAQREKPYRL